MRSTVPDVLPASPRKSSFSSNPSSSVPPRTDDRQPPGPTTFFLAREPPPQQQSSDVIDIAASFSDDISLSRESTASTMFGVQSLEETVSQIDSISPSAEEDEPSLSDDASKVNNTNDVSDTRESGSPAKRRSTIKPADLLQEFSSFPHKGPRQPLSRSTSPSPCSLTPLLMGASSEEPLSLPSSPKSTSTRSLKPLDDASLLDETNSQAVTSGVPSGGEEDSAELVEKLRGSPSQLIMPSIRMPSRRPFTCRGKSIGRFKIMVTGARGSGKSSLIRSIVQLCKDIVHVDSVEQPQSSTNGRRRSRTTARSGVTLSEIYASTKPYPPWWSDLEDSRVLRRRRKSTNDVVLERNLCFVDGSSGSTVSRDGETRAMIHYMKQQLSRAIAAVGTASMDLRNMLGGNGGSQVDAVLYLMSEDSLPTDMECMRELSRVSNVIPLIAKADLLSADQIAALKSRFQTHVENGDVQPFLFGAGTANDEVTPPFAVSSARADDDDNMDASVLMSPDYEPPLIESELSALVERLFDPDSITWLRHSAAKKLIQAASNSTAYPDPSPSSSPILHVVSSYPMSGSTSCSYTSARLADYTQREEQRAHAQLAKWAADLQRSLRNERERYLQQNQQPSAHTQTALITTIERNPQTGNILIHRSANPPSWKHHYYPIPTPHDPLGLIQWNDDLRRRSWFIVQVVGSVGVVGGLALWLARAWGWFHQHYHFSASYSSCSAEEWSSSWWKLGVLDWGASASSGCGCCASGFALSAR